MENKRITFNKKLVMRILLYVLGVFILALGVVFSVNSKLGVSAVSSPPYVLNLITGISMGTTTTLVYIILILLQIIVLRREFKWINLTQLLVSAMFGYFIDFFLFILGDFMIPTYAGQLTMLAISILLISIGVVIYVNAGVMNMPMEGLVAAVNQKILTKFSFGEVKMILDTSMVVFAVMVSLLFLGNVQGVREGTVLSAVLIGLIMKKIEPFIAPKMNKVIN